MAYRVVQWSVGGVGRQSLRALVQQRRLRAGRGVHPRRVSGRARCRRAHRARDRDRRAGHIGQPVHSWSFGPTASCSPPWARHDRGSAVADLVRILGSGANVVSSSMMNLIYPPAADPERSRPCTGRARRVDRRCSRAASIPASAATRCPWPPCRSANAWTRSRVQELSDYGAHPDSAWATPYGFGQPEGAPAPILEPGVPTLFWGGMITMLADILGVELEGLEEFCERWYTPEAFDVPIGRIEKATLGRRALRGGGVVGGRAAPVRRARDADAPRHGSALAPATRRQRPRCTGSRSKVGRH